jgi:hypothetical protein
VYDARIQAVELDTSKEEVLFNDSDIEDDSAVGEAVEVEQASEMKALLAGTSQDDSVFLPAADDRRYQFFLQWLVVNSLVVVSMACFRVSQVYEVDEQHL